MMDLDLSAANEDVSDVLVTMQIPAGKHSYLANQWADSSVVIVPSDSEDDDDITVISELPSVMDLDNDDCILESYQPGTSSNGALTLLTVKPIVCDSNAADIRLDRDIMRRADAARENVLSDAYGDFNRGLVLRSPPADMGLLLFAGHSNVTHKRQDVFGSCESYVNSGVVVGRKIGSSSSYNLNNSLGSNTPLNSRISVDGSAKFDDTGLLLNFTGKISMIQDQNETPSATGHSTDSSQQSKDDPTLGSAVPHSTSGSLRSSFSTQFELNADTVKASSSAVNTYKPSTGLSRDADLEDLFIQLTSNAPGNPFNDTSCAVSSSVPDTIGDKRDRNSHEQDIVSDFAEKRQQTSSHTKSFNSRHDYLRHVYFSHSNTSRRRLDSKSLSCGGVKKGSSSDNVKSVRLEAAISGTEKQPSSSKIGMKRASLPCSSLSSSSDVGEGFVQQKTVCMLMDEIIEPARCCCCAKSFNNSSLSYCVAGHSSCGDCLQNHVKTLLASGTKGSVKCLKKDCSYFYATSQLSNSLPKMVVEILEEKYNREFCDELPEELGMQNVVVSSGVNQTGVEEGLLEIPKNWKPMKPDEPYLKVELAKDSDEYNWVSGKFRHSMDWQRSQITRIYRVQNHVLWQFYVVRRRQMARDLGSSNPVQEKHLFHGTSHRTVDAICLNNFDWRLCGSHGTMYGQGSYFAKDAAYSHMYTDPPPGQSCRHPSLRGSSMQFVLHSPYYRRSLLRANSFVHRLMRSVHGPKPHLNMPSMSLPPPAGSPLPAHQPLAPDMGLGSLSRLFSSFLQPAHQPRTVPHGFFHQAGQSTSSQHTSGDTSRLVAPNQASVAPKQGSTTVGSATHAVSPYYPMCSTAAHSNSGASVGHYATLPCPASSRMPNVSVAHHPPSDTGIGSSGNHTSHPSFGSAPSAMHSPIPLPAHLPHPNPAIQLPAHLPPPAPATNKWGHAPCLHAESEILQPAESHHVMFLSKVLVGESTVGCSEFRKPPPIDPSRPYDRCYDTCVNRLVNPSIYVVFNSSQCYPEYIIEYTNKNQLRADCI